MFIPKVVDNLQQAPKDNPQQMQLTNQNYKTHFQRQSNYLPRIKNKIAYGLEVAMHKKWPKNHANLKDNAQETTS